MSHMSEEIIESEPKQRRYTVTAMTENTPGVLHRITSVFTRRHINIESLTVSETEREGVSRFTVTFFCEPGEVDKLVKPMRRFVEVLDAFASPDQELLYKEIAFLRVGFGSAEERERIKKEAARFKAVVVMTNGKTLVMEKTGKEEEINVFKDSFRDFKIVTFIRSGRIAIKRESGDKTVGGSYVEHVLEEHV